MTKQTEALKLALEGLEKWHFDKDPRGAADYITAIREALAEQCICGEPDTPGTHRTDAPCLAEQPAQPSKPFDTHTAPGWAFDTHSRTPQPSKPWVGLTEKEIDELWDAHHDDFGYPLSASGYERAIEAKLKEKNA